MPALIRKAHEAKLRGDKTITVWGTGKPRRDFLFSRDLARACFFLAENYDSAGPINVGPDADWSIAEVAETVRRVVGYEGQLEFDAAKPDGAPVKRLDASPLRALGWTLAAAMTLALPVVLTTFIVQFGLGLLNRAAPALNLSQDLYVSDPLKTLRVMVKDEDVCLHCGLCAERCPTGAWDMQKFLLQETRRYGALVDKSGLEKQ